MKIEWNSGTWTWLKKDYSLSQGFVNGENKYTITEVAGRYQGDHWKPGDAEPGTFSLEMKADTNAAIFGVLRIGNGKTLEEMKELAERNEQ